MKSCIFKGLATAIPTPFKNNKVDLTALEIMLKRQINASVDAVVILGTTGEPETLSQNERKIVIQKTIEICHEKTKVIVGCGSNSTAQAIKHYKQAELLGADGALIVTPYYNKCTQKGLYEHYNAISNSGNLPIIVYNVPARTGVNISPEALVDISTIKNVCGIKEAGGNISQILDYFNVAGDNIAIYSGEDSLNNVFMFLGGSGAISVVSNIVPKMCKKVFSLFNEKKYAECNKLQQKLLPLTKALFVEVNPIPVKAGLCFLGLCKNELRPPLCCITNKNYQHLTTQINKIWESEDDCL